MDHSIPFISMLFDPLCPFFRNRAFDNDSVSFTDGGKVEQVDKTIIARLNYYMPEYQRDLDIPVQYDVS